MTSATGALWRKSVADIVRRKTQSLLILVAILVPVAGLTAVGVAASSLSAAYRYTIVASGTRQDVAVVIDRSDPGLLDAISHQPAVIADQLATTMDTQWQVATAPGHVDLQITGYAHPANAPLTPLHLIAGHYPGRGEVVMDYGDRALGATGLGDTVTIDTATGTASLRVVGDARSSGQNPATSGRAIAYMSATALNQLPALPYSAAEAGQGPIKTEQLSLQLRNPVAYQSAVQSLGPILRAHHASVLAVLPPAKNAPLRQIDGILTLARALLGIAVALAALLVINAVTALVAEQSGTIATLKALGATRARIVRHYWATITGLAAVATPAGLAVGVLAGGQIAAHMAASIPLAPGPPEVPSGTLALGAAVGLTIPALAALIPIRAATRVTVRQALSGLGIATPTATASAPGRLPRVGMRQTVRLGIRAVSRKPWRAALSVLTLGLSAVSFLVVASVTSSVERSIQGVWGSFRADVEVYVGGDNSYRHINTLLAGVPNIARIERVGWFGSQTPWGKVGVWGLEPQSELYHTRVEHGHWFTTSKHRVCLISADLASRSGLRVGSSLDVPGPGAGHAMRFTVIGIVDQPVDDLSQVGTIDMPVHQLYLLEGAPAAQIADYTNRVLVQADDRSVTAVDRLTRMIDQTGRSAAVVRNPPIAEVFRFHDEVVRHQRNFLPIQALLLAASALVALMGLLGLADALSASVTDQRRDIGLLRALGASGRDIVTVLWTEALTVSLAAWTLALAAGIPLAYLFVQLFSRQVMPTDFHLAPLNLLAMVAVTITIASVASLLPARRAAALRPSELLRTE
jgi:putative ABC transport system permease protein